MRRRKFHVGDMVKINSTVAYDDVIGVAVTPEMINCAGKIAKIQSVISTLTDKGVLYYLSLYDDKDDSWHVITSSEFDRELYWSSRMFTLVSSVDICSEDIKDYNADLTELLC